MWKKTQKPWEGKGRMRENLIIYTLRRYSHIHAQGIQFVGLFICSFSTRGKEEETGRGAGGGRPEELLSCRRYIERGERRGNRSADRRQEWETGWGWGAVWKNCPVTSVRQACIGECAMSVHEYHRSHCLNSNKNPILRTSFSSIYIFF